MIRVRTILDGWIGAPGLNTFYFDGPVGDTGPAAADAFARVHAFWTELAGLFPNEFSAVVEQTIDILDAANGDLTGSESVTDPNNVQGTDTSSDFLPGQTMAYMAMRTGQTAGTPPRRVRGGSYIGPMAENINNSFGQISTEGLGTLGLAAHNLLDTTGDAGSLCVWHRPTVALPDSGVTYVVIDTQTKPAWAHLTSRRR